MTYIYGMQGFPAVGGGLGGLPVRRATDSTKVPITSTDPFFSNVVLLLNGNSGFTDSSASPKTVTPFGNAQVSSAQTKFGSGSIYCDGNGDFIRFEKVPDVNTLSGNFTIEAWVYRAAIGAQDTIFSISIGDTGGGWNWSDTGKIINGLCIGGKNYCVGNGGIAAYSSEIPAGVWSHIACVRNGTVLTIYINGNVVASTTFSDVIGSTDCSPGVGVFDYYVGSYRFFWNGYIDEFRITNGIARYTENFTPPSEPFPNK